MLKIDNPLSTFLKENKDDINDIFQTDSSLGILDNGLAGVGLNIMKIYEKEDIYI